MSYLAVCTFCVLIFGAVSLPLPQDAQVNEFENNNDGSGNYNYRFSLSDGTKLDETGELKEVQGGDGPAQVVIKSGSYEFVDPDGNVHKVTYTADEEGFHPIVES